MNCPMRVMYRVGSLALLPSLPLPCIHLGLDPLSFAPGSLRNISTQLSLGSFMILDAPRLLRRRHKFQRAFDVRHAASELLQMHLAKSVIHRKCRPQFLTPPHLF